MSLKILLIHPGSEESSYKLNYPPWGIIYIAKTLIRSGYDVSVLDLNGIPDLEKFVIECIKEEGFNVIGMTAKWGHASRRLRRIQKVVKKQFGNVRVVLGGPLLGSIEPTHPICEDADKIIIGDGETGMLDWLRKGMPEKSENIPKPSKPVDLNENGLLPFSGFDLSPYIVPRNLSDLFHPAIYISAARGCVGSCQFCYRNTWRHGPFRCLDPDILVQGMVALSHEYKIKAFYFLDDNLLSNWDWTEVFCKKMQVHAPEILWGCDIRASEITEPRLEMVYKAGGRSFYIGLECYDDDLRTRVMGKTIGGRRAFARADLANQMGFHIRASIALGWPQENFKQMNATFNAVVERNYLNFDYFCYTPLPRVPLTEKVRAKQDVSDCYWNYDMTSTNFSQVSDDVRCQFWKKYQILKVARDER